MKIKAFEIFFESQLDTIKKVCSSKNHEYARSDTDALANFKRRAEAMKLDPLTIIQTDVYKHFDAINSFIIRYRNNDKQVLNEPIQQRARDIMIYMVLFMGLIEDLAIISKVREEGTKTSDASDEEILLFREAKYAPPDKSQS